MVSFGLRRTAAAGNCATLFLFLSALSCCAAQDITRLNITAIGGTNGKSTIECWQITRPFDISSDAGTAGSMSLNLDNLTNMTLTVLPPKFDGGLHNAPFVQYVAFTSGIAVVSLPDSKEQAVVHGGKYGMILAADTAAVSKKGHITRYPSDDTTTALQIRIKDNVAPPHTVLHKGACRKDEVSEL